MRPSYPVGPSPDRSAATASAPAQTTMSQNGPLPPVAPLAAHAATTSALTAAKTARCSSSVRSGMAPGWPPARDPVVRETRLRRWGLPALAGSRRGPALVQPVREARLQRPQLDEARRGLLREQPPGGLEGRQRRV